MNKIMIVEDTITIREELCLFLTRNGYEVVAPNSFENILQEVEITQPDLILLDINLPIYDGFYLCKEIRKVAEIPIIIVTSRDSEVDELIGMNLGADDFITKPYNTQILLARIVSVLKRSQKQNQQLDLLRYKGLTVNLATGSMSHENKTLELTKNELKILACLIKNSEKIVSRDVLMDYLWNSDLFVDDNTLSVNVTRLRKKLEEINLVNVIETRRGLGYILQWT